MSMRSDRSDSVPARLSRAVVIAPARPGAGGQGAAAADMARGLAQAGLAVSYVDSPPPTAARRWAGRRPLRRFGSLARALDRRAIARVVPGEWDLAYAMPAFVPAGPGTRVLHQATRHPAEVRRALTVARRAAGGGRGFMTEREMHRLVNELRAADLVRTESVAVADELRSHGTASARIVTAPPGVDLTRFTPGQPFEQLTIAFVGVLSLWKGLDVVAALARALRGRADVAVVGGPVCPWSRRLSHETPFVRHADVPALLARAHALVLPSASEGFGYVVLEAMASGAVPFVSPEVGAAEVVRRIDGRLVHPRPQFAEAVAELVRSLPLAELGARARAIAEEYEREKMAEQAARRVLDAVRSR